MVMAQTASEVTMLSRKMDIFLNTQKNVRQEPEASAAAAPTRGRTTNSAMSNRMKTDYRNYLRAKICKNPISESRGSYRKSVSTREKFYDPCVLDGGVLAHDFFKSIDPGNASALLKTYTPDKGVSLKSII